MDTDTEDWILIAQATPKRQSAPKQVPVRHRPTVTSLSQPLTKGGKAVPPFVRPNSLTAPADLPPRQSEPEACGQQR